MLPIMRIQGEHRFDAPRERVWECLMDPEVLQSTLPGFQKLEEVGENEYAGVLSLGVGPVQGRFEGRVRLEDIDPPSSYRLVLSGRGAPGFVEGEGTVRLEEEEGGTKMLYDLDMKIGGRVAGVGQRMLDMTARMMSKHAIEALAKKIRERAS